VVASLIDSAAPVDQRVRALVIAAAAAFMVYLDATIANVAFPAIHASFPSVREGSLSWVLNSYNIAFAALLMPAGVLLDRFAQSRERLLAVALLGFSVASLCCALAPSEAWLVGFRGLQGLAAGALIPAGLSVLLARESEQRLRALAILASSAALAASLGPSVGGVLVHVLGWRSIFLLNLPIGLLAALGADRLRAIAVRGRDFAGGVSLGVSVCAAGGVGVLSLTLSDGSAWGWLSLPTLLCALAGGGLLAVAVARARANANEDSRRLFSAPASTANVAGALLAMAFLGKILTDVLFLTGVWRYSILQAGLALTPGPVITTVLAVPCARLAERLSVRAVAAAGGLVYGAGAGWYALRAGATPDYLRDWLPGALLTGAGLALALPALTSAALSQATPSQYGAAAAVNATARALGGTVGIAATTAIVAGASGIDPFRQAWSIVLVAAISSTAVMCWPLRVPSARLVQQRSA